jgi:hypothetical protein
MADDGGGRKRKTLTRAWRRPDGENTPPAQPDTYVECTNPDLDAVVKVIKPEPAPVVDGVDETAFETRMNNWRRTVRGGLGGGAGGYCAAWAKWYVMTRLLGKKGLKQFVAPDNSPPRVPVTVHELDGWLVEAAVRSLVDYNERRLLHLWYVWQYREHFIRTKLLLRHGGFRLLRATAENNLMKVLDKLENAANLLSNNLHAGVDPRPETKVALDGAALSLEKQKALSDSSFGAFCIERSPDTFSMFPSIFAGDDHEITDPASALDSKAL